MAYFIHEVFGFAANKGINAAQITAKLASRGLGLGQIISDDTEHLVAATIKYADLIYKEDEKEIDDISIQLEDRITGELKTFSLGKDNNVISFAGDNNLNLDYVNLLGPNDSGASKQRYTIAHLLVELEYTGHAFEFKAMETNITDINIGETKKLLSITVYNKKTGNSVNINQMLLKYGVCKYSNLGSGENGHSAMNNKAHMLNLENEAYLHGYGKKWSEEDFVKAANDESKRKPTENFKNTEMGGNSRVETNKFHEIAFSRKGEESDAMFKIGDVWLKIPPTHITISQMRNSYTTSLIGQESKPIATPVNRTIIKLNIVFTDEQVHDDLVRIITQFRYCPVNLLRSKDLFNRVAGLDSFLNRCYGGLYYIPVTMDQYTLYNVDGHPGTISGVFEFSLFNFSAYIKNPSGLEYHKYDPWLQMLLAAIEEKKITIKRDKKGNPTDLSGMAVSSVRQLSDLTPGSQVTFSLEEASHPYNAIIDKKVKEVKNAAKADGLYDMGNSRIQFWKVDMDRYFNASKGLATGDIETDTEKNLRDFLKFCVSGENEIFSELAQSISVTYNNVFAYQPIMGQSHPVAQYIGPGETVVSINLKGIDMEVDGERDVKNDQAMMCSVLKSWAEKQGTAEYGFFDDRYFVRSTLLNLAEVNIVSVQNTIMTSVESKPGLFDINILLSKSMFEYNLRNNPIATLDEYYGLSRMTRIYGDNKELKEIAKKVNDKIKVAYSTLADRLGNGLTLNGSSPALNLILQDIFSDIKNNIKVYWDGKVELPKILGTDKLINSTTYVRVDKKTIRFTVDGNTEKVNLKLNGAESIVKFVDSKDKTLPSVVKVSKVSIKDNIITVDVTFDSDSRLPLIAGVEVRVNYSFLQDSKYTINNTDVYRSLIVVANSESFNAVPGEPFDRLETKAKYVAFVSILNEINEALNTKGAIVPYSISNSQLQSSVDGVVHDLADNKEFMDKYFANFLIQIGSVSGAQYEANNGRFTFVERQKFIRNMMGGAHEEVSKNLSTSATDIEIKGFATSTSNNYHIATGNGVIIEYTNTSAEKIENSFLSNKTYDIGNTVRKQIDSVIALHSRGYISSSKDWKQVGNTNKWQKLIVLTEEGKKLIDKKSENILANEIEKNKKVINEAQLKVRELAHAKPYAAHRYYPLVEGYVGWSQLMSSSVGDWFVTEMEEDTINRFNNFKEVARTSLPWNRDAKLFSSDPHCPNSAFLRTTEASGMFDFVDVKNNLSAMAAIARPKMNRDNSAATEEGKGVIPDVQFLKKKNITLFGENAVLDPSSENQVFNTMMDYMLYRDPSAPDNQPDYRIPGTNQTVRAKFASNELYEQEEYKKAQKEITDFQVNHLISNNIDASKGCESTNSQYHYTSDEQAAMVKNINRTTLSSVIVNGQSTPMGLVTSQTTTDEGTNELGYIYSVNDSGLKASTLFMKVNAGHGALNAGYMVRGDIPIDSKTGKALYEEMEKTQKIPDMNKKVVDRSTVSVEGDKLSHMLAASYVEGLPATKGIMNAFPTYKMYIIKSDTSEYKFSSLDDYWDYRLVQDIMVVRDKNTPTHMLKARVVVDPRYITIGPDYKFRTGVENRLHGTEERQAQTPVDFRDTAKELKSVYVRDKAPLRAGMRICIKLGYHTDPRYLDTVFIGTITQLNGGLDTGLYELSAEGDGRELRVPAVHFSDKFKGNNYADIINAIMRVNPNVVHFGKIYGSFLRRMSYGHKNLAQLGMLGVSAIGAFGAGVAGVAVAGGAAVWSGSKVMTFKGSTKLVSSLGKGGGAAGAVVGAVAAVAAGYATFPIAFGEFQQMGQWCKPAFEEVMARNFLETDWGQDIYGKTHNTLTTNIPFTNITRNIPLIGELSGFFKGNVFNANKQAYQLSKHFYQTYKHGNNPLDDNIFAVDIWNGRGKASLNINNKQSIWDVLQNVRRLYPNYALDIRPYGSRSTIFLGPVGFNYWRTDDPVQAMLPQLNQMEGMEVNAGLISRGVRKSIDTLSLPTNQNGDSELKLQKKIKVGNDNLKSGLGLTRAPFIPFQKHHIISSDENIIMNGLKPTPERGWNAVSVTYNTDPSKMDPKKVIDFMADLDIYPEAIIRRPIHIDFTDDAEVATRYALGFLKEGVERLYGGTIIVKGNSKIEPYDKVYINDKVNKMYGWIQVETVIHKFDQEMGFTTHIVPNMVCEINNNAYLSTQKIVMSTLHDKGYGHLLANFLAGGAVSLGASAIGFAASPLFAVGALAYFLTLSIRDFRNSWEEGKAFVDKYRNLQLSEKKLQGEKMMIQDIMMNGMEQDAILKGVKFGWAIGYLRERGAFGFIKKGDIKGQIKDAGMKFDEVIKSNYRSVRNTLSTNLGPESPVARAWGDNVLQNKIREKLRIIEKTDISTGTVKYGTTVDAAKAEWTAEFGKFRSLLERGEVESAKVALNSLKAVEAKIFEAGVITDTLVTDVFEMAGKLESSIGKPGLVSSAYKGISGTASKGFGSAWRVFGKVATLGGLSWMALGASEIFPSLAYSFAVKAVSKNNVMALSPIYWRETYLMPSLDGYMANDTFSHVGDMLINAQSTLTELRTAVNNYLPQVFPIKDSKFDTVEFEGLESVQDTIQANFSRAAENIKCIVKNSGLKSIPSDSDFASDNWNNIAQFIRQYGEIGNTPDSIVTVLAILYFENKFKLSGTSKKNAHGIGQIVPSEANYNDVLRKNASTYLLPYVGTDVKSLILKQNFGPVLDCVGSVDATRKYFIEFNIKSICDILNDKLKTVRKMWWKEDGELYKKVAKSKHKHIVLALLLYAAYNGFGEEEAGNFGKRLLDSELILPNGNLSINLKAASFDNYTSEKIMWREDGFLSVYLAMAQGYSKCYEQQQRDNAQAATQERVTGIPVYAYNDFSGKAIRARLGEYALRQKDVDVKVKYGGKQFKNEWDCSGFVRELLSDLAPLKRNEHGEDLAKVLKLTEATMNSQAMYNEGMKGLAKQKMLADALPGDLVFFKDKQGKVKHVEICVGNGLMAGISYQNNNISVRTMVGTHKKYGPPFILSYFNY